MFSQNNRCLVTNWWQKTALRRWIFCTHWSESSYVVVANQITLGWHEACP